MVRVFIITGGTGGHIFPAIEVKKYLDKLNIKTYLGVSTKNKNIFNINFDFTFESAPFKGQGFKNIIKNLTKIIKGTITAFIYMIDKKPDAVFIFGSFASFPFFIPSLILKKKIFVFEQNSIPGLVTRIFSKFSKKIFVSFKETEKFLKKKCIFLGNPVRDINLLSKKETLSKLGIPSGNRTILFMGGSQGAKKLIEIAHEYSKIKEDNVIVLAGKFYDEFKEKFKNKNFFIFPFREDIESFYSVADIVVSRAGAGAVFELLKIKKKAILIPFPYATSNHQYFNALFAKKMGTFRIILEKGLTPEKLLKEIDKLYKEKEKNTPLPDWKKILKKEILECFSY